MKDWALEITKTIRHLSYERSLSASHKAIAEAENIEDLPDENSLCTEDLSYAEDFGESISIDHDESFDLAVILFKISDIREHDINSEHIVFRERHTAIYDNNAVPVLKCRDVHSDLLKSAERCRLCFSNKIIPPFFSGDIRASRSY